MQLETLKKILLFVACHIPSEIIRNVIKGHVVSYAVLPFIPSIFLIDKIYFVFAGKLCASHVYFF